MQQEVHSQLLIQFPDNQFLPPFTFLFTLANREEAAVEAARQASLSNTNFWNSLKLMSIESVMPSSHLILCHPLLLLPSNYPSIRVFSSESTLRMSWPNYWSFSFNISPSNEHPGLISFRMDWLDLLAVHGTLKIFSLLEKCKSKLQ